MAGPGPLARLRTWLLGIENLQRRILLVLAVLCLVPVIYAYLVYKPYRGIHAPAPELADTGASADSASRARNRPTAEETAASVDSVEHAVLARNTRPEMPEILPSWHRDSPASLSSSPASGIDSGAGGPIDPQQKPSPELPELPAPTSPPSRAADQPEQPQQSTPPDPAPPASLPTENPGDATAAGAPTDSRSREPLQSAGDTPTAKPDKPTPPAGRQATQAASPDSADSASTAAVDEPSAESNESGGPGIPPEQAPAREPLSDPSPADEPPPEEVALADAESAPPADESLPDQSAEVAEAAALDRLRREYIEDLLAGYRTSFENGWLEEFLEHFTATPRENSHQGQDWFRSNYGWLFENTAERELNIDILDMTGAGDHWVVLARFEMRIDYPDRPTTRSSRQVRYRIETNEHDQFRIAAIEY